MANLTDIQIRFADRRDVADILGFIHKLAEYEQLSDQVVADEATLTGSLFDNSSPAEVLIAEMDGTAVGFALFFHNFSTFIGKAGIYLEDIYVDQDARGNGIGRALFKRLGEIAIERDCGRMEWSVLDWNSPAINFYRKLGAEGMEEWTVYRLDRERINTMIMKLSDDVS